MNTPNQLNILCHSLGIKDDGSGKDYRNHYCIPIDFESKDLTEIRDLVARGLMAAGSKLNEGRDQYFHVTDAGRKVARAIPRKPVPKLSRSKKRYQEYLEVADCFESFWHFLKHRTLQAQKERYS